MRDDYLLLDHEPNELADCKHINLNSVKIFLDIDSVLHPDNFSSREWKHIARFFTLDKFIKLFPFKTFDANYSKTRLGRVLKSWLLVLSNNRISFYDIQKFSSEATIFGYYLVNSGLKSRYIQEVSNVFSGKTKKVIVDLHELYFTSLRYSKKLKEDITLQIMHHKKAQLTINKHELNTEDTNLFLTLLLNYLLKKQYITNIAIHLTHAIYPTVLRYINKFSKKVFIIDADLLDTYPRLLKNTDQIIIFKNTYSKIKQMGLTIPGIHKLSTKECIFFDKNTREQVILTI